MHAIQMVQFILLPSMLLAGFMLSFKGMLIRAHCAGEVFPGTHALPAARRTLPRGNGSTEIAPELWPIAALHWSLPNPDMVVSESIRVS